MRWMGIVLSVIALLGCGAEVATTAATGTVVKKQELDAGKKTLEEAQQKVDQAVQATQQRTEQGGEK